MNLSERSVDKLRDSPERSEGERPNEFAGKIIVRAEAVPKPKMNLSEQSTDRLFFNEKENLMEIPLYFIYNDSSHHIQQIIKHNHVFSPSSEGTKINKEQILYYIEKYKNYNLSTLRSDKFIFGFDRVSAKTVNFPSLRSGESLNLSERSEDKLRGKLDPVSVTPLNDKKYKILDICVCNIVIEPEQIEEFINCDIDSDTFCSFKDSFFKRSNYFNDIEIPGSLFLFHSFFGVYFIFQENNNTTKNKKKSLSLKNKQITTKSMDSQERNKVPIVSLLSNDEKNKERRKTKKVRFDLSLNTFS
jgi:hypothetical protein